MDDNIISYEIDHEEDSDLRIRLPKYKNDRSEKAIVKIFDSVTNENWIYIFYKNIFNTREQIIQYGKYDTITVIYYLDDEPVKKEDSSFVIDFVPRTRRNNNYSKVKVNGITVSSLNPIYVTPDDGYMSFYSDSYYMFIPKDYTIKFLKNNDCQLSVKFGFDYSITFLENCYNYNHQRFAYNNHQTVDNINIEFNDEWEQGLKNIDSMLQEQYPNIKFT